jgi:hypothetical protein
MASDREFERGQQVGPGAVDEALEPAGRDLGKLEDPFIAAGLQLDWSRRLRGREALLFGPQCRARRELGGIVGVVAHGRSPLDHAKGIALADDAP